jgi:hypothetical protein
MKKKVSMRELERRICRVSGLKASQAEPADKGDGMDVYNIGLYNGLELACAVLFDRKPRFMQATANNKVEVLNDVPQIPVECDEIVDIACAECGTLVRHMKSELMEDEHGPVESIICRECRARTSTSETSELSEEELDESRKSYELMR